MICPYCDRVLADAQELSNCPHCGGNLPACQDPEELRRTVAKTLTFPDPPIGKYKDADGYLEIGADSLTIFSKPFFKGYTRTIQFHKIYAVSFEEGNAIRGGFLCIREWKDRYTPLKTNVLDAASDETSLCFRQEWNKAYRTVYLFLKKVADINRQSPVFWEIQKKEAELEAAGTLFCPACFSTSIQSVRVHKPLSPSPYVRLIHTSVYITRTLLQMPEPEVLQHTCSICGHQWTAQKK